MPEGQTAAELEAQLPAFVVRHFPEVLHGAATLRLQPLTDIRLGPAYDYEIAPKSDMTYVMLFSAIPLFILLIAAVNFVNLTTARATRRAGEIGVRKALVVGQFALSALLIVGALDVDRQLDHLTTLDLGFEQEEVVLIPSLRLKMLGQYDAFKDELLDNPGITGVTLVEDIPGVGYQTGTYTPEGLQEGMQFHRLFVHDDFADVLGVELAAGREFDIIFLDSALERQYRAELNFRRVAGGFMKLVGLAIVISWPLAWIVVNVWLDDFAYAIEPGPGPFVVSAVLVTVIAAGTLVYHSVSAAGQNPVDSVRSE